MTRNAKVLGVALVAVFAMSAMLAQGAAAKENKHTFTCTAASCNLSVSQEGTHELQAGAAVVKCEVATATGTQVGEEVESVTVTPAYGNCKIGSTNVEVKNEGCKFKFTGETTKDAAGPTPEALAATVHICDGGGVIKIVGPGCTIDFESQTKHGIQYSNSGGSEPTDVKVVAHVGNITYNATNAGCALLGVKAGVNTNGVYKGNSTVTGKNTSGTPVGVHVMTKP